MAAGGSKHLGGMRCSEHAGSRAARAAAPRGAFRAGRSHKIAIPDRHWLTAEFSMPSPDRAQSRLHGRPVLGIGSGRSQGSRFGWHGWTAPDMRSEQLFSSACNCPVRGHRATGGLPGRRWRGAAAIVVGSAAPTLDAASTQEDPVPTRNTEMSLTGEAGTALVIRPYIRLVMTVILQSHVCDSGALTRP